MAMVRLVLASAVSVGALWVVLRHVKFDVLWHIIAAVQPAGVIGYLLALSVTQIARAWRWRTLLLPLAPVTKASAWRMSNVGNMLIMLLPLRLGEFSRPLMLKREYGRPLSAGMGAAVVERVLDGLLVTLLFFATTALLPAPYVVPRALWVGAVVALTIFSGALVGIVAMLLVHDWFVGTLRKFERGRLTGVIEKAIALLEAFAAGMRALPTVGAIASVVAATLLYWGANAMGMVALMHAFGWSLPVVAGATLVCVLVIGVMIPAGPGLLGTYQAALVAGLGVYQVSYDDAVAFSLVAYIGNLLLLVAFGVPHVIGRRR